MRRSPIVAVCLSLALGLVACGPRMTPEQRVQKLRLQYQILPVGSNTIHDAEGNPTLVVDLRVVNEGTVHLPHLTVRVEVRAPDGKIKASRRATLDLAGARPGVGVQVAAQVPGVEAAPEDQVTVELESHLPAEVLRQLPEFADLSRGGES